MVVSDDDGMETVVRYPNDPDSLQEAERSIAAHKRDGSLQYVVRGRIQTVKTVEDVSISDDPTSDRLDAEVRHV